MPARRNAKVIKCPCNVKSETMVRKHDLGKRDRGGERGKMLPIWKKQGENTVGNLARKFR